MPGCDAISVSYQGVIPYQSHIYQGVIPYKFHIDGHCAYLAKQDFNKYKQQHKLAEMTIISQHEHHGVDKFKKIHIYYAFNT